MKLSKKKLLFFAVLILLLLYTYTGSLFIQSILWKGTWFFGVTFFKKANPTKSQGKCHNRPMDPKMGMATGWWQLKYSSSSARKIGEDEPFLTSIFFQMGWFNHQPALSWDVFQTGFFFNGFYHDTSPCKTTKLGKIWNPILVASETLTTLRTEPCKKQLR